ncbi:KAP family P-loop NTPase fold protein [Pontibacter amylolyticus]|uniref:KAP NTPase domain-containing protein n=1 Tax=Pontibacter amylolyticus TaxID=1424080 RepID=A0ABQ1W726_9BACT|nr:P-loop NTPase fold protein [Pontibacter amylolyticus]GGG14662.1 hypothetical protein GCM10011323_18860 [Pontibacter amylolyticus]
MDSEIRIKFLEYITTKKTLIVLLSLVLLIVFWDSAWDKFDEVIVIPALSKVEPSWILDWLHIVIVYFTIILTAYAFVKDKKVSTEIFLISALSLFIYTYWRFVSDKYNFVSLNFIPFHKHSDLIYLLAVCISSLKLKDLLDPPKEPIYYKNPFLVDKPIIHPEKDLFGREKFAREISNKIQSRLYVDDAGALAIGINGVWGSGKTSFNNLVRSYINHNNRIVIDFNPWSSTSSSKIIEDFFENLVSEMAKYDPKLSKNIYDYSKTLTSIDENAITKGLNSLSDFLFNGSSRSYDEVNTAIGNLKKQILVFIDDLDRLDKKEIIEVLRLIRNTANFNNVVYIVSYDKEYVEEAIHDFNPYNYKSFLEKIFQFEFTLPKYEKAILRRELKGFLNDKMESKYHTIIENAIEARSPSGRSFTNEIVRTKRDVIRLANSILFEFSLVQDEVHFVDLYLLQLLKLKYQNIYESLYEYQNVFFIAETRQSKTYLRLRKESEKDLDDSFRDVMRLINEADILDSPSPKPKDEQKIKDFIILHNFIEATVKNSFDKNIIKELIDELLNEKNFNEAISNLEQYKSFAYPGNFHKYFSFQLLATDLPSKEFEEARRGPYELYKHRIFAWIEEGKLSEILDRLDKINDFTTLIEFENHLKISIDIGKHRKNKGESSYGLNYWQIVRTLKYPIVKIGPFKIFENKEKYREYIHRFFSEAPSPYFFESNVIVALMSHLKDFVLTNEELTDINLNYFKKYCKENKAITSDFRELYHSCVKLTDNSSKEYEIVPEAVSLFKSHFRSYLTSCELSGFISHTSPMSNYFQLHLNWVKEIFNSVDEFENYIETANNLNKDECYSEFLDFFEKSKDNLFNGIEYEFKSLNPSRYR